MGKCAWCGVVITSVTGGRTMENSELVCNSCHEKPANDPVNSPSHYTQGGIECIVAIEAMLGPDGFKAFCQGNSMKYLWRYKHKGRAAEDLDKANWYLDKLRKSL